MRRKLVLTMAAALLLAAGCGGGLSPESEVEGEIGSDAAELGDEWKDAEEELLAMGRPVEDDWPCMTWRLSSDGPVLVEAQSDDFDPVLAVYGEDGGVLALCDDWEGDLEESLVALESVPDGATLVLFGAEGDDGEFELSCLKAGGEDLEEFALACDLSDGVLEGYKPDEKDDHLLEEVLEEALQDHVYKDFSNASVHGFSLDEGGPVRVTLESDDFDTYLVLLEVDGDELSFIDYNDDGGPDMNSALMSELEEGRYLAVALSYTDGESGDYLLEVESVDEEMLEPAPTEAGEPGVSYGRELSDRTPVAYAYTAGEDDSYVPGLSGFTPVAAFEFTVENPGIYQLDGFAETEDVVLSLWDAGMDPPTMMEYNDDGPETGTDSRMVVMLSAGEYLALVNTYSGELPGEELGFSWQPAEQEVAPLRLGRAAEAMFTASRTDAYYSFEVEQAGTLTVTADGVSEDIDPYMELRGPGGNEYTDDDGGEDFNSRLELELGPEETGEWTLHVTTFSGGEGRIRVRAEHTLQASPGDTGEMPEPGEPPAEEPPSPSSTGSAGI